ncbi:TRAP transporter large permease [Microbacterium sp. MPKO10]|uniref:TRAP transporter large permease n=1 Tax=Microbacterium sp. MPKO10 TaxID=2989818 RepID=UPI00223632AB|nr:TRAP transporter large permease subunit [Microbacterium sp. MPKO10]MCW4458651.1 TRAP transporter large permease subunit [Microbacterium sp. MPKO10]
MMKPAGKDAQLGANSAELDSQAAAPKTGRGVIITVSLVAITTITAALLLSRALNNSASGIAALVLMLALIFLGVPVGLTMVLAGALGIFAIVGFSGMNDSLANLPYTAVASWSLSVLPMFILMGLLLWRSGVTGRLFEAARAWLNWLPGGLAVTTNFAGAGLAAVSGSTAGITYAIGRLSIPEMLKSGYNPRYATGTVLMSGLAGQLIPPSILSVIYAGVAGTSVGQQLLAGIVPGVAVASIFAMQLIIMAVVRPSLAPKAPRVNEPLSAKLRALAGVWPIAIMLVVVIGGIFSGIFTATEAAAYGAGFAVLVTLTSRSIKVKWRAVSQALLETASSTAAILLLIAGAALLTRMLSLSGVTSDAISYFASLNLSPVGVLLLLMVFYLILGMALDPMTMIVLTVPILLPLLEQTDISLLMFGAFIVLLGELASVTPPVGMMSYIVHKITSTLDDAKARAISLVDVFIGAAWFIPGPVILLLLLIFFPEIATWLPGLGNAK